MTLDEFTVVMNKVERAGWRALRFVWPICAILLILSVSIFVMRGI